MQFFLFHSEAKLRKDCHIILECLYDDFVSVGSFISRNSISECQLSDSIHYEICEMRILTMALVGYRQHCSLKSITLHSVTYKLKHILKVHAKLHNKGNVLLDYMHVPYFLSINYIILKHISNYCSRILLLIVVAEQD